MPFVHERWFAPFGADDDQLVDLLVLAVAAVVVGVEVADDRTFDDRLRAFIDTGGCNQDKALQVLSP